MRTTKFARQTILASALLLFLSVGTLATTIRYMSLSEYTSSSSSIVRGYVVEKEPVLPQRGMAFTTHQIIVTDVLKRDADDVALGVPIEVLTPGARDATRWVQVDSSPRLDVDDDVLLFLWRNPVTRQHVVTGWSQGTYHIRWDDLRQREQPVGLHARGASADGFLTTVREEVARQQASSANSEVGR